MRPYDLQPQLEPCFGLADAGYCASTEGPGQPGLVQTALLAAFDDALRARQPLGSLAGSLAPMPAMSRRRRLEQDFHRPAGASLALPRGRGGPPGPTARALRGG